MPLIKQKGNMYEFVTHMWGPIVGTCSHKCSYCYVPATMAHFNEELGKLRISEKNIDTNLGSDNIIFVCHTCDLFAEDVPAEWIERVLAQCRKYPKNRYLLQTKNPKRILEFAHLLPLDVLLGTTIETNRTEYYESKAPSYIERAQALGWLSLMGFVTMVTIEPIFDFDLEELVEIVIMANPKWINVGADSKGQGIPEPSKEKVTQLIESLQDKTDVELKRNLERILGDMN